MGARCYATPAGPTQNEILAPAKEMGVATFPTFAQGENVYHADGERTTHSDSGPLGTAPPDGGRPRERLSARREDIHATLRYAPYAGKVHRERLTVIATITAAVVVTGLLFAIEPIRDAVAAAFSGDLGEMRAELDSLGAAAALVLIGIALVHAVVPFPAEFPTAAAGFVLGFAVAFPLMVLAWTLSCLAAYGLARVVGPFVLDRLVGEQRMAAADRLINRGGWPILLAGRLIPVVPYNVVSYAAGATRVPLGRFAWTTALGVMPLTALTALLGQRLQEPRLNDPILWGVLLGVVALLALARPVGRRLRASQ